MVYFGVDIGGTTVKLGCFDEKLKLVDKWEIPTDKTCQGENILPDVVKSIEDKLIELKSTKEEIAGIGIGVPGPVFDNGTVNGCVNLGWGIFDVTEKIRDIIGMPQLVVKVGNDANVAALGEMVSGSGKGYRNLVMITLGTGVGGGIILNGSILSGSAGGAGEIGHMPVEPDEEEMCTCGKAGCLEQYASATGIVKVAKSFIEKYDMPSNMREISNLTAKNVVDCAKDGDQLACMVMEQLGEYLGRALAGVAVVVNPEAFVIGGGVSKAGQFLIDYIEKHFKKNVFGPCKDVKFVIASLGNDAGIYGAVAQVCR